MPFAFEKLVVYQRSILFADSICTLTRDFPRGYYFLVDQLNRAALSIAANIAEGNGRFTKADRRNFFGIARGSVQECVPLLELAARQKLVNPERHVQLLTDLEEIARMLSGLIKGLVNRQSRSGCKSSANDCRHRANFPVRTRGKCRQSQALCRPQASRRLRVATERWRSSIASASAEPRTRPIAGRYQQFHDLAISRSRHF